MGAQLLKTFRPVTCSSQETFTPCAGCPLVLHDLQGETSHTHSVAQEATSGTETFPARWGWFRDDGGTVWRLSKRSIRLTILICLHYTVVLLGLESKMYYPCTKISQKGTCFVIKTI